MTSPTCHLAPCTLTGTPQRHLPPASSLSAHSQEHKAHLNDISHVPPRSLHTHRNTSTTSPTCLLALCTSQEHQAHLNDISHLPPRSLHTHRNTSTTSPTCHLAHCTLTGTPQQRLPRATSLPTHPQAHLNDSRLNMFT